VYIERAHKPLTVIARRKALVFHHLGLFLHDGTVAHCTPERGEHRSSLEEFCQGERPRAIRPVPPEKRQQALQHLAASLRAPKAYDIWKNNCETFVNRLTGDDSTTTQVGAIVAIGAVALLLGLAAAE
jgi:hypothetical protein